MATNIQTIKTFPQLIKYLRTDLGWPVDEEDADNLTFDYDPEELGLDEKSAVKVRAAKQLRPLVSGQPWGIFWVDFEPKKLPVTVMRRILNQLVAKKRGGKSNQATWNLDDLLFISAVGSEKSDQREITFAHFHQEQGDLPTLRVLGWDGADTVLKIDHVARTLQEKLRWPQNPKDVETWRVEWSSAFKHKLGHSVKTADELAHALAALAGNIRGAAQTLMAHESEAGRLRKLHKAFQTALIHDLSEEDFADTYAQTITYGLLTAAVSRESGALVADDIAAMVPNTNPFLKEMLPIFLHAGGRKGKAAGGIDFDELGIQDVVELLRSDDTDLQALLRDFGNKTQSEDPVVYFYEHFLTAYNKSLKVLRGVFYTPKPAVSYIVRGVHELLQSEFGLEDGLAATITWGEMARLHPEIKIPKGVAPDSFFVTILDPATGTATFLVEVVEVVERTMKSKWARELRASKPDERAGWQHPEILRRWNEYVAKCLLPRLYGYELMMAPYAIAHMKLGLKLHETGYRFASDQRANIYLTNALEEPTDDKKQQIFAEWTPALAHEAVAVNDVKRNRKFTVIVGNPPYSKSLTKNEWIANLIKDFKGDIREKKSDLNREEWKFLRFSLHLLQQSMVGYLGYIINNAFLSAPTHRELRRFLLETTNLEILDLHGDSNKGERSPDGSPDENVFEIQQGVCITIAKKINGSHDSEKIKHLDLFGNQNNKYGFLLKNSPTSVDASYLKPQKPWYLFYPQTLGFEKEYENCIKLQDIFTNSNTGIQTKQDKLFLDMKAEVLAERMEDVIANISSASARTREKYGLEDSSGWKVIKLYNLKYSKNKITPILYKPFDKRFIYFEPSALGRSRYSTMQHMLLSNLGLLSTRQITSLPFNHVFVSSTLIEEKTGSHDRTTQLFPLFLYPNPNELPGISQPKGITALSSRLIKDISKNLNLEFIPTISKTNKKGTFDSFDVFYYIYAVMHSPTYRERYGAQLKVDFPRIPFTHNVNLFRELAIKGGELVSMHLMESSQFGQSNIKYIGKGDDIIATGYPEYYDEMIWINNEQGFENVSAEVWEFRVGGYPVCQKWLKDRRGLKLSNKDISHYNTIVESLSETILKMEEIDNIIEKNGGWPIN